MTTACRPIRYETPRLTEARREHVRALFDGHDFTRNPFELSGFRTVEALK